MKNITFVDWISHCFYTFDEIAEMSGLDLEDDYYCHGRCMQDFEDDVIDWASRCGIQMLEVSTGYGKVRITELN